MVPVLNPVSSSEIRRQRNRLQIKRRGNFRETHKLKEMEGSNLRGTEFKAMVINMLKELRRIEEVSENFNKEIGSMKKV